MKQAYILSIVFSLVTFMVRSSSYADEDMIYGCYKKNDGQLRILNQAGKCLPSENPISWNKVGQPGSPGAQGPSGPTGPEGPPGISVRSASLPEGDPNCLNGGSQFTSATDITYACNGEAAEGGAAITIGRMVASPCGSDGYGWCPSGLSYSSLFHIRDLAINERSVIAVNVFNPYPSTLGCEVTFISPGEFSIMCNGWNRVEREAILHYAIFNQ